MKLHAAAFAAVFAATAALPAEAADLVIAMPNWPSGQATANILKESIAKKFGLEAEVRELGTMSAFVGLDKGEVDIQPEVWRPNFEDLIKKYVTDKGAVVLSGRAVSAWQGLCATPEAAAAGLKTIADLNDPAKTAVLDTDGDGRGEVWIGAPTWLSTGIERVRANSYGYGANLTLVEAEEDVAMAAVDAAVATARPMVFYCYAPHHVFELHKLTRIEEPPHDPAKWKIAQADDPLWVTKSSAATAWDTAHFHIAYGAAFGKKHPDIAKFLEEVDFSPAEVTAMSYALEVERQAPSDYAKKWVDGHAARIDGWAKQ
ncbi:glycine betaine ABC transporter substrate-binding protein [Sinorhizobium sp. 7-81]|uniref:ABC transporter substrate-binding protein n=1 Tax=Sinorhizobium sp. 8-89 TaxID=3049089 RepID=UPI0024C22F4E|nr:glycine betaine ABC transporter substrate-binding protein [Sinorhizobium sp. 8-89]MDK1494742.1 glycine betaine ABC transporter substrate-binding protein [Sinorhizobium sp. 8-89]